MSLCTQAHRLIKVQTEQDFITFHRICRITLFKGNELLYRENHFDREKGYRPLLLFCGAKAVAAICLQLRNDNAVVVRSLAVLEEAQNVGHGKSLLEKAAAHAIRFGKRRMFVNSEHGSVGFYESAGFAKEDWDLADLRDPESAVQMVRVLP